ncbi:hypothetical protein EG328_005460 [Venturia inaequalis]|uniref:Uncharacterized protein n=1 Tax=Venturia inaequalis TaxID=5025 RepID=A0A8H3VU11_VENIN|nr:hypothetical protein EG328_005460 [Venturia inaequalis]KAE9992824.1 hypothetical protein EG327_007593 [Venturia inaequalis]
MIPSFWSLLAAPLLISHTFGAPSWFGNRDVNATAISQDLLDKFGLYEQYAAAAYCASNYESPPDKKLKCPVGNCPRVEAAGTEIVHSFSNSLLTDTSGYVAFDHTHKLIIVSFRGSESFRNYLTFVNFPLVPIDLCVGCLSAAGYYAAWQEVKNDILRTVEETHGKYPDHNVVVTGHSLGGGIASIAVGFLREKGHIVDLATFGAPRIGNEVLVKFIQNATPKMGENFRIVHVGDPASSFPLTESGFRHLDPEYLVISNNKDYPTTKDVIKRKTDENGEEMCLVSVIPCRVGVQEERLKGPGELGIGSMYDPRRRDDLDTLQYWETICSHNVGEPGAEIVFGIPRVSLGVVEDEFEMG